MKTLMTLVLSALLTLGCSMTGQVQADDDYFSQAELDSMLAPVALYPDSVLSHVLIAATYPLEVIQAARWSRERPGLRGEDAVAAVEYQDWDPSVKALVAFPELLERMDDDLQWTQRLGDAFLMQEEDLIASIQYLRSEAYSQGHLASNDRVKVVREKEYIYIEPARTRVVYVPYYDPRVIYSSWRWSSHPPVYWHRPSGFSLSVNFHWGRPYYVRPNFYFSSFHWAQRRVVVVNHHHHYYRDHGFHSGRQVARFEQARHWKHDPTHRRGVSYRGRVEQTRFVDNSNSRPASARQKASTSRSAVRSDRREWAAERRSSATFDRQVGSTTRSGSRSERVAELRGGERATSRVAGSERGASRSGSARVESSSATARSRTVTERAPERAASRSGGSNESTRSPATRASRISESLRSGSSSRTQATSRSPVTERSSERASSRSPGRSSTAGRTSRSDSKRSSVAIPRDLTVRSSSSRERSSTPSRSARSAAPSGSTRSAAPSRGGAIINERSSAPSRQSSAPSRSHSGSRESAPSRVEPMVRSSAPGRSTNSSSPSRSSRAAPSPRSTRSAVESRSRGGDSRRGGRGGERERQ